MKGIKKVAAFFAGMVTMAVICLVGTSALASPNITDLSGVMIGGIRIVMDGQELHPTDVNGNTVEPLIYNGTTYLPVRAVANAVGKAVYWDGPNFTVYLGDMDGKLEYPTVMLKDMTSISDKVDIASGLTDNYDNTYGSAIHWAGWNGARTRTHEYLTNMKYTHIKGTLYVPSGENGDGYGRLSIIADGKNLYTSPDMTKTSSPIPVDVNITGYNDIKIETSAYRLNFCLADAGFYQ